MLHKIDTLSLTQKLYRAEQVRLYEKKAASKMHLDMYALMQRAGAAVFEECLNLVPNVDNYLILVGMVNAVSYMVEIVEE